MSGTSTRRSSSTFSSRIGSTAARCSARSSTQHGDEQVVALAEYARLRDPAVAEVAFTVADELQGRGAATRLLEQLAARAGEAGIEQFVAEVLPENAAMLAVFRDAGFEVSRTLGGGEVEVRFPIASTEHFRARVEERDHIGVAASLRPFFAPASVAVIGASKRRGSIGGELFRNIIAADFAGAAYPVNRAGEAVAGVRAYRAIEEIPDPVDLAVICVPGERVLESAEAALRHGVRACTWPVARRTATGCCARGPPRLARRPGRCRAGAPADRAGWGRSSD